jgi:hypothetical protein
MTKGQESNSVAAMFADEQVLEWMEEHVTEVKHSVAGQRILYESLILSFVVGLAAHIGGYALLASMPSGVLGLLADLLHALGWSLWTGVVVAVFVQVIPEVKRRQIRQAIKSYEALQRDRTKAGGNHVPVVAARSPVKSAKRESNQKQRRNRVQKPGKSG